MSNIFFIGHDGERSYARWAKREEYIGWASDEADRRGLDLFERTNARSLLRDLFGLLPESSAEEIAERADGEADDIYALGSQHGFDAPLIRADRFGPGGEGEYLPESAYAGLAEEFGGDLELAAANDWFSRDRRGDAIYVSRLDAAARIAHLRSNPEWARQYEDEIVFLEQAIADDLW